MLGEVMAMASLESISSAKIRRRKKLSASDTVFIIFIYAFFIVFAFVTIYPLFNTLMLSFSDGMDAAKSPIIFLPRIWSLKSYKIILFDKENIRAAALTTMARTLIGTAAGLGANALLAFILSRKRFLFKSGLSMFWTLTIYVQGSFVTTFILYKRLGLMENFWVYIIPCLVSGFYVLVIRTYMNGISDSLEEAAKLDGAGYIRIFWSIISPVCKPVYAAIALFIATSQWNAWFDAMAFNRHRPDYTTLQYELEKYYIAATYKLSGPTGFPSAPPDYSVLTCRAALSVLSMLPLIIAYPFLQKYFASGLKINGIKE